VKNHPFTDGNERAGFVLGVLFLEFNGALFEAKEEDSARAVIDLAGGKLDADGYADWLRTVARRQKRC